MVGGGPWQDKPVREEPPRAQGCAVLEWSQGWTLHKAQGERPLSPQRRGTQAGPIPEASGVIVTGPPAEMADAPPKGRVYLGMEENHGGISLAGSPREPSDLRCKGQRWVDTDPALRLRNAERERGT